MLELWSLSSCTGFVLQVYSPSSTANPFWDSYPFSIPVQIQLAVNAAEKLLSKLEQVKPVGSSHLCCMNNVNNICVHFWLSCAPSWNSTFANEGVNYCLTCPVYHSKKHFKLVLRSSHEREVGSIDLKFLLMFITSLRTYTASGTKNLLSASS